MRLKLAFKIFFIAVILWGTQKVYPAGTVAGDFLLVSIQARETALAGIYGPCYARPGAATANPAALSGIKKTHIMFSHYESVFNSRYEQLIYAVPMGGGNAAGSYFMYSSNDEIYRTDQEGYAIEKVDNYDITLAGIYSMKITPDINAGINLKLFSSKAYKKTRWGIASNIGALYRNFESRYMMGFSAENLGLSSVFFEEESFLPVVLRFGYAAEVYRYVEEYRIMILLEERIYIAEDESPETSLAMEAYYRDFFVFRYGYIFGRDEGRVGIGAGVMFDNFNIDYAYQPFFLSDNVHRFTFEVTF